MALGCSIFIVIGTFSWVLPGRAVLLLQSWTGYWGQILVFVRNSALREGFGFCFQGVSC